MSDLREKHIVIIGGSSGIGLTIARLAAAEGATLTLIGRHQDRLEQAKDALSGANIIATLQADAHDHATLPALFEHIAPCDHLVSMVGDAMGGGFVTADMAVIEHVIHSKFLTNVLIGKLAANKIRDGGSLLFTSGTGGKAQHACASYVGNLGIKALTEGLAAELSPAIRVNAVAPTWTPTTFWRDQPAESVEQTRQRFADLIPLGRTASVEELACAYLFLMKNDFITGQQLAVDGGVMLN